MNRRHAWLLILLCASAAPAQGPAAERPSASGEAGAGGARPELKRALRDYYVQVLADELAIPEAQAQALEPLVHAFLDSQRESARDVGAAALAVRAAADGRGDAAAALAGLDDAERSAARRVGAAREQLLSALDLRQQARLLAFEQRFRQRVRELVQGRGPGGDGPPDGPGQPGAFDDGPGDGPHGPPPGGRPPRGPDGRGRPEGPPPRGPEGPGGPGLPAEMRETLGLLLVHQLRTDLGLDEARTLRLLPLVDAFLDARFSAEARRMEVQRRLRAAAWGETPDSGLEALVREARTADTAAVDALIVARKQVTDSLGPRDGARFVVLAREFEQDARRRMHELRRAEGPGRPEGPRHGPGGRRPEGPPDGPQPGGDSPWRRGGNPPPR